MTSVSNPGSLTLSGSSLLDVLAICSNIPSGRIFTNSPLPDGRFEFMIKTPSKKPHVVHDLLRQAIENAFGLVVRHETKVVDLLVLTAGTGAAEHLSPTAVTGRSSSSSGGGSLRGVNLGIDSLSASLEGFLGRPVVNETQLTNRYDFQLLWDEEGPADAKSERISAAVREQLGLVLTPSQRPLEVVIVEAAGGEQRQSFPDKQQTKSW